MATSNVWVNINIDGRQTEISGGPRSKEGGMEGTIMIRHNGERLRAVNISAGADKDGNIFLRVSPAGDMVEGVHWRRGADGSIIIQTKR